MRLTLIGALAAGLLCAAVVSACLGDEATNEIKKWEPTERQVLLHEEAQRHRVSRGLPRQEIDQALCELSQRWAEHMARTGSRSHGGGENIIAWSQRNAAEAVRTWIHSSGHNYWLLSNTSRAGWGAAYSERGGWMWVGAFRGSTGAVSSGGGGGSYGRRGILGWRRR